MSGGTSGTVVFSGGGTGGHVFPGLAVAEELRSLGWKAVWIGRSDSLEQRLAARAALDFHAVPSRPFVDHSGPRRLLALVMLLLSTVRAALLLRRLRAAAVVATGGHVCAPTALASRLHGCGLYLLEPNAQPGAANRLLSRFAAEAGVAFESATAGLACRTRLVGVPVRRGFLGIAEPTLEGELVRVLVLGGSQGAEALNRGLPTLLARAARLRPLSVTHQSGPTGVEATRQRYDAAAESPALEATVVGFIEDTAAAMAAHDLIVSRAGAVTVAEVAAAGRPALYVPLPLAAGHQRDNARAMVASGAAVLVEQDDLETKATAALCAELLGDRERLLAMAKAAGELRRGDAAATIASRVAGMAEQAGGRS